MAWYVGCSWGLVNILRATSTGRFGKGVLISRELRDFKQPWHKQVPIKLARIIMGAISDLAYTEVAEH